jgi:hypothetical protein
MAAFQYAEKWVSSFGFIAKHTGFVCFAVDAKMEELSVSDSFHLVADTKTKAIMRH